MIALADMPAAGITLPGAGLHSMELEARPEAVGTARSYVAQVLAAWAVPPDVIETAILLTSELATNALTHGEAGRGTFIVHVRSFGCCIGVEVSDNTTDAPVVRAPLDLNEHGRGLILVAELADSWGYHPGCGASRKHVWFHLRAETRQRGITPDPRLLAVEALLADPEALGDDVLEGCLYLLRDRLRGTAPDETATPAPALAGTANVAPDQPAASYPLANAQARESSTEGHVR